MNKRTLFLVLVMIVLGNGLRSVVTSSIFMSEGSFASFLSITVEATAVVIELLMGAVLVALLLAPAMMKRVSITVLAVSMAGVAALAAAGLAAMFWVRPPVDMRIIFVILLFPGIGFSLAVLAPVSQRWTQVGGSGAQTKLLLGAWSLAMPMAFLVTPQIVRVLTPRYGLDVFFAGLALALVGLMLVIWLCRKRLEGGHIAAASLLEGRVLWSALAVVIAFQALTILTSLDGVLSPTVPLLAIATVVAGAVFWRMRGQIALGGPAGQSGTMMGFFISLFLLNVATTGFYDTSFLVLHSCSNTLIADRSTLAALAQMAAAALATGLLARHSLHRELTVAGLALCAFGLVGYLAYPGVLAVSVLALDENVLFVVTRMMTGFGAALATTAIIFALSSSGGKGSGAAFLLPFVMIIGTEMGLEIFEVISGVWMISTGATSAPFGLIFALQATLAMLALLPFAIMKPHQAAACQ